MNAPGPKNWRETDLVPFGFRVGPYAGVVERLAGVGGGARSSRNFFFNFVTLKNEKSPQKLLPSRSESADPNPGFRGIVVWWEVRCLTPSRFPPCRGLVIQRVAGVGGGAFTFEVNGCV